MKFGGPGLRWGRGSGVVKNGLVASSFAAELVFLGVGLLVFVGFSEFLQDGLLLWFSLTANCENVSCWNGVEIVVVRRRRGCIKVAGCYPRELFTS